MKYKKLILSLLLIFSIIRIISTPFTQKQSYGAGEDIKDQIIRFHVRANSDKEEDQSLKLKVRDRLLDKTQPLLENSKSIDESREIMTENLDEMKSIAEGVIKKEGKTHPVEVSLSMESFPTRKYGDLVFPAGQYETLMVEIGEGQGQNWWCVMFPPLCFVDNTDAYSPRTEEDIEVSLSLEEEPPLILKSKLVEFYQTTSLYISDRLAKRN